MASLTPEQLKIMEEKKQAALLRKQRLLQGNGQSSNLNLNSNVTPQGKVNNLNNESSYSSSRHSGSIFSSSKCVAASLSLISEDRFIVNMPYHNQSIEMFKTVPGKMYDPKSKLWTFPLSSYDILISKFQDLKPGVTVSGIPRNVLNTMKTPSADLNNIDISKIDKELRDTLMPFQEHGIRFGISRGGRCLIADDMGLGKTIQALGIAHYFKENWPLLIVCPSSMRFPWEEAIQTFLPSVSPFSITVMTNTKDFINEANVVICSYDLMKSSLQELLRKKFGVAILDESHSLKNWKSARTKASAECVKKCKNVILLSGTPILSRPEELHPQISMIDPFAFRSFSDYGLRYCDGKKDKYGWNYHGSSNMEELEIYLKKKIMIRRLKSEVISQLPSKLRKVIVLQASMVKPVLKQMKAFESQMEMQKGMEKRSTLMHYYALTGTIKLNAVCDYLNEKLENNNKFLVFGHHKEVLNGISDLLIKKNIKFIRIDGSTSAESRKDLCDQFQTEENCRVAVLSIKAANSGITLTAANLVIFAELYWNPGELTQAEDRAHRIGQYDSVVVEYLVAKGTADDHIWKLVQSKLNVLNKAGLTKDNFKDADNVHLQEKNLTTTSSSNMLITDMFKRESPKTSNGDLPEKNSATASFSNLLITDTFKNGSPGTSTNKAPKVEDKNPCFQEFDDATDEALANFNFEDISTEADDDALANFKLEDIEFEYEVEKKKRKTTFD